MEKKLVIKEEFDITIISIRAKNGITLGTIRILKKDWDKKIKD